MLFFLAKVNSVGIADDFSVMGFLRPQISVAGSKHSGVKWTLQTNELLILRGFFRRILRIQTSSSGPLGSLW